MTPLAQVAVAVGRDGAADVGADKVDFRAVAAAPIKFDHFGSPVAQICAFSIGCD